MPFSVNHRGGLSYAEGLGGNGLPAVTAADAVNRKTVFALKAAKRGEGTASEDAVEPRAGVAKSVKGVLQNKYVNAAASVGNGYVASAFAGGR